MIIQKYKKDKANKYKVLIDDEEYTFYDDVIIQFGLLMKKEINKSELEKIENANHELESYYRAIKYITKKMRSKKEMEEVLHKWGYSELISKKTMKKLEENHFLNDELYLKAFISDELNLSNHGPKKIRSQLLALGINEEKIDDELRKISFDIWKEKMERYINKRIEMNHHTSARMLKMKISHDLVNLGYEKEDFLSIINKYDIIDEEIAEKEYQKIRKQLEKKYSGSVLENKIKERMYRKGFSYSKEMYYEE